MSDKNTGYKAKSRERAKEEGFVQLGVSISTQAKAAVDKLSELTQTTIKDVVNQILLATAAGLEESLAETQRMTDITPDWRTACRLKVSVELVPADGTSTETRPPELTIVANHQPIPGANEAQGTLTQPATNPGDQLHSNQASDNATTGIRKLPRKGALCPECGRQMDYRPLPPNSYQGVQLGYCDFCDQDKIVFPNPLRG